MDVSVVLFVVCLVVAGVVTALIVPRISRTASEAQFARFAAASGLAALGCALMYGVYTLDPSLPALVLADTAMVSAPATLYLALRALNARLTAGPMAFVAVWVCGTAAVTALVPQPASLAVKAIVLAAACAMGAVEGLRSPLLHTGPMRAIVAVSMAYTAFSAARVIVGAAVGWRSDLFRAAFSFAPTTFVGATSVLVIGTSVAVIVRRTGQERVETAPPPPRTVEVRLRDAAALADTHGSARVEMLRDDLQRACRAIDADAIPTPDGAIVSTPHDHHTVLDEVAAVLRQAWRWSPDDVSMIGSARFGD